MAAVGVLGACAGDSTATAPAATSALRAPGTGTKSLSGTVDGSYVFDVDPRKDQKLYIGDNVLSIPAGAICDLATSSYGPEHWDERCAAEKEPLTITAIVANSATDHPSIEFYPAMRFNPKEAVSLYFYVPVGMENPTTDWTVLWCDDLHCVDESLTDPVLAPVIRPDLNMVFRRIKHFSGYLIQPNTDGGDTGSGETPPPPGDGY